MKRRIWAIFTAMLVVLSITSVPVSAKDLNIYHGDPDMIIEYDGDDIRYGYIPLDQELFNIFQLLLSSGKYESVSDSWQLFCNYSVTLGNKTSN